MTHLSNKINYPDHYLLKEDYRPTGKFSKINPLTFTIFNLPIITLLAFLLAL